jgi:hypothetical protein
MTVKEARQNLREIRSADHRHEIQVLLEALLDPPKFQTPLRPKARVTADGPNHSSLRAGDIVYIVSYDGRDAEGEPGYSVADSQYSPSNWYVSERYLEPVTE